MTTQEWFLLEVLCLLCFRVESRLTSQAILTLSERPPAKLCQKGQRAPATICMISGPQWERSV